MTMTGSQECFQIEQNQIVSILSCQMCLYTVAHLVSIMLA